MQCVGSAWFWNYRFLFTPKVKVLGKGHFRDLSKEYKFIYVPRWISSEKNDLWLVLVIFPAKLCGIERVKHPTKIRLCSQVNQNHLLREGTPIYIIYSCIIYSYEEFVNHSPVARGLQIFLMFYQHPAWFISL